MNTKVHFRRKATLVDLSRSLVAPSRSQTNATGILMSKSDLIGYHIQKHFLKKRGLLTLITSPLITFYSSYKFLQMCNSVKLCLFDT